MLCLAGHRLRSNAANIFTSLGALKGVYLIASRWIPGASLNNAHLLARMIRPCNYSRATLPIECFLGRELHCSACST